MSVCLYACMSYHKCRVVQIAYRAFLAHGKNDSILECSNNFILQVLNNEVTEQVGDMKHEQVYHFRGRNNDRNQPIDPFLLWLQKWALINLLLPSVSSY